MLRLVIAHRCTVVRDALRIMGAGRDIHVVGEAAGSAELVDLCRSELPDVVVAEGDYDDGGIETALPQLVATGASVAVICGDPSPARMTTILGSGARGWLGGDTGISQVLDAVAALGNGDAVLDPPATRTIVEEWRRYRLAGEHTAGAGS